MAARLTARFRNLSLDDVPEEPAAVSTAGAAGRAVAEAASEIVKRGVQALGRVMFTKISTPAPKLLLKLASVGKAAGSSAFRMSDVRFDCIHISSMLRSTPVQLLQYRSGKGS